MVQRLIKVKGLGLSAFIICLIKKAKMCGVIPFPREN